MEKSIAIKYKNEDSPVYFEKVYSSLELLRLLKLDSNVVSIDLKPDRKDGEDRRIEDLTKFFADGSVEVIQLKHSIKKEDNWTFSGLWETEKNVIKKRGNFSKSEGTIIYKFLKSWRYHNKKTKNIKLFLVSNKECGKELNDFYNDIDNFRNNKIQWGVFYYKYKKELANIKANCEKKPFVRDELPKFIKSLYFRKVGDNIAIESGLKDELKERGIYNIDKVEAFIIRVFKAFTTDKISFTKIDVNDFIRITKTELLQRIVKPPNYLERSSLESILYKEIERKKEKGGFIYIFAPSGSGKTTFLSNLAEKNKEDFLPYFCHIRNSDMQENSYGHLPKERLNSKWFKVDIIQRCKDFNLVDETISIDDDEATINILFEKSLEIMSERALKRKSKKIVIIVDALDQVSTDNYKDKSLLEAIPARSYPGVIFLLSTWGEKYIPQHVKNLPSNSKITSTINLSFTENEIINYFKNSDIKLSSDQIKKISSKTKGLAILLFYLLQKLKGSNIINYDSIINNLGNYSDVFGWYDELWNGLNKKQKEYLGYICFHLSPINKKTLLEILTNGKNENLSDLSDLMVEIRSFVDTKNGNIQPYHDSFRRFILFKLKDSYTLFHLRIAQFYSKKENLSKIYCKKYLTTHLDHVGVKNQKVKNIFLRLLKNSFFTLVLKSNLDYISKIHIGKHFIAFFRVSGDIKSFIEYSIKVSQIEPYLVGDDDIFIKAKIGTPNLVAEIENELLTPKDNNEYDRRNWVFNRLKVADIFKESNSSHLNKIADRYIEDALFRIDIDKDILWSEKFKHNRSDDIDIYIKSIINLKKFNSAIRFIKKLKFKEKAISNIGLIADKLTPVFEAYVIYDEKAAISSLNQLSQAEKLIICLKLDYVNNIKIKNIIKPLLIKETLYKYLSPNNFDDQRLSIAEACLVLNIKNKNKYIEKLINNLITDVPYYSHNFPYWGNSGDVFFRCATLKLAIQKKFNIKEFYIDTLEKLKRNASDYNKDAFINILQDNCLLKNNYFLLVLNKIDWNKFHSFLVKTINIYKEEIGRVGKFSDFHDKYNGYGEKALIYYQNINLFLRSSLRIVSIFFPKHISSFDDEIENIFKNTLFEKNLEYLNDVIIFLNHEDKKDREKINKYYQIVLNTYENSRAGNIEKSNNFKDLSEVLASKSFINEAESIYTKSLKHSNGLWEKEDLRVMNFIDCLRGINDKTEFDVALKYIKEISNVVSGSWYFYLDFIEAVTYSNHILGLEYLYILVFSGDIDLSSGLRRYICTCTKVCKYKDISDLMMLLELMPCGDGKAREHYENRKEVYYALIEWSLINSNFDLAIDLSNKYLIYLNKYVYIKDRLDVILDFCKHFEGVKELGDVRKVFKSSYDYYIRNGYVADKKNNSYEKSFDEEDINTAIKMIKRNNLAGLFAFLSSIKNSDKSYRIEDIVSKLLPLFSDTQIISLEIWSKKEKVDLFGYYTSIAMINRAVRLSDRILLNKVKQGIIKSLTNSRGAFYHNSELIKNISKLDFFDKRKFIRKMLLICIERSSTSMYSLQHLFLHNSDVIDEFYPELKSFAFEPFKRQVEYSMKLTLAR